MAILEEAEDSSVHIETHPYDATLGEVAKLRHVIFVHVVVVLPLSVRVLVAGLQVDAPNFLLA